MVRIRTALLASVVSLARVQSFVSIVPVPQRKLYSSTSSSLMMKAAKRVLVPIADGSEEIETVSIQDTLVRCGAQVTVASVMSGKLTCKMSRGIQVMCSSFYHQTKYLYLYGWMDEWIYIHSVNRIITIQTTNSFSIFFFFFYIRTDYCRHVH